jgi:acetyltransferase-like isoleucine patch superfamily enzyme
MDLRPRDHMLNKMRNLLYFRVRYPMVRYGRNVHVQWSTFMASPQHAIVLGNDVGIGANCRFQCDIEVGNKVLIAANVGIIGSDDHRYDVLGKTMWDSGRGDARKVVIDDDVWIGFGAIILSGCRIGRGSIVGAGSVVVGDVEPYSIVIPQKARVLRKRFTHEEIQRHEDALNRTTSGLPRP